MPTLPQQTPQLPTIEVPTPPTFPEPRIIFNAPTREGLATVVQLEAKRSELSTQLSSVVQRRHDVARELARADPSARAGLEQRLQLLDARIISIEQEIARNGEEMAQARKIETTIPPIFARGRPRNDFMPVFGLIFAFAILFPLIIVATRAMWRRSSGPTLPPGWNETNERLERMERAVDAIAVEVERVSEGQRFMAKLMVERGESADASLLSSSSRPDRR